MKQVPQVRVGTYPDVHAVLTLIPGVKSVHWETRDTATGQRAEAGNHSLHRAATMAEGGYHPRPPNAKRDLEHRLKTGTEKTEARAEKLTTAVDLGIAVGGTAGEPGAARIVDAPPDAAPSLAQVLAAMPLPGIEKERQEAVRGEAAAALPPNVNPRTGDPGEVQGGLILNDSFDSGDLPTEEQMMVQSAEVTKALWGAGATITMLGEHGQECTQRAQPFPDISTQGYMINTPGRPRPAQTGLAKHTIYTGLGAVMELSGLQARQNRQKNIDLKRQLQPFYSLQSNIPFALAGGAATPEVLWADLLQHPERQEQLEQVLATIEKQGGPQFAPPEPGRRTRARRIWTDS